jgi:hypothetical protein
MGLTAVGIAAAPPLAAEAANALRDRDFVDPAVPDALEELANAHMTADDERLDVTWLYGHGFIKLLIAKYPDAFQWLEQVLRFLEQLPKP